MTPPPDLGLGLVAVVGAYGLGSIPSGVLIARASGRDLFSEGSGNIGATNVWRTLGPLPGLTCFVLDGLKGFLPPATGFGLVGPGWWGVLLGLFAMLGHTRSCFLGFRGGKAVATGVGVLAAVAPAVALGALFTWLGCLVAFRMVSLASVIASLTLPVWAWMQPHPRSVQVLACAVAIAIPILHRSNMSRIRAGTEPRIGRIIPFPAKKDLS